MKPISSLYVLTAISENSHRANIGPDGNGLVWANLDIVVNGLGQDLSEEQQRMMLAVHKPISVSIYGGVISNEGWRGLKVWYLVSENDQLFPPSAQHASAKAMGAQTLSLASGHMSPLAQPELVAQALMAAANVIGSPSV